MNMLVMFTTRSERLIAVNPAHVVSVREGRDPGESWINTINGPGVCVKGDVARIMGALNAEAMSFHGSIAALEPRERES